jgi:hypothetical protein
LSNRARKRRRNGWQSIQGLQQPQKSQSHNEIKLSNNELPCTSFGKSLRLRVISLMTRLLPDECLRMLHVVLTVYILYELFDTVPLLNFFASSARLGLRALPASALTASSFSDTISSMWQGLDM